MYFTRSIALLAVASFIAASPVDDQHETSLALRQEAEVVELSIEAVVDIAEEVVNLIKGLWQLTHQDDAETKFTQATAAQLQNNYPSKNIAIYSDTDSVTSFQGATHSHYDLDIGLGFTKGYEIWVFDSGSLDRAGDGGYVNWCVSGNFYRDGSSSHVQFYQQGTSIPSKMRRDTTPAITYNFNAQPGSNKTHTALHPPVTYAAPKMTTPKQPPSGNNPTSDKGSDNGNYFVQCKSNNGTSAVGLAYYKSIIPHGGNKNQLPDDFELLAATGPHASKNATMTTSSHDAWRFPVGALEFEDTKTTVHWSLFANAVGSNVTTDQIAGIADNGQSHFYMYKDDGEQLFVKDQWTCNSLYYAF